MDSCPADRKAIIKAGSFKSRSDCPSVKKLASSYPKFRWNFSIVLLGWGLKEVVLFILISNSWQHHSMTEDLRL